MPPPLRSMITGVILAGGRARRMGGQDKGLIEVAGRPMVAYIIETLRPQVSALLINANRHLEEYAELGECPVIRDDVDGFVGPLAGMASAMRRARSRYLLTVPCDSPLLCETLASRLAAPLLEEGAELAVAHDGERLQPVFALLGCELLSSLLEYLRSGERKIDRWYARHRMAIADLSDRPDTFLNINSPPERDALERTLSARRRGC